MASLFCTICFCYPSLYSGLLTQFSGLQQVYLLREIIIQTRCLCTFVAYPHVSFCFPPGVIMVFCRPILTLCSNPAVWGCFMLMLQSTYTCCVVLVAVVMGLFALWFFFCFLFPPLPPLLRMVFFCVDILYAISFCSVYILSVSNSLFSFSFYYFCFVCFIHIRQFLFALH